ncbi:endolytic transglycosylase MltG [Sulfurimonas sp.]|uniref:endolytic transglycosylase MltG n=1 Tax=Sulfurimonas sp. TaxID=2022749 RepID=UPI003D1483FF
MNDKRVIVANWIFEIALIIALSFMYYLNQPIKSPRVIYIPEGSINKIITQMQQKHYNVTKLDTLLLRIMGSPQSGWIDMKTTDNSRWDFLYKLTTAKAALVDIRLIPGETTYIFLNQLAEQLQLSRELLEKEYALETKQKEGAFAPNTYKLPMGITEKMVIKILLYESDIQMKKIAKMIFGRYDEKKWLHFVTIASIIQKESASIEEMPLVSSVIYNRLKKGMKLQMDGTLNYGPYSHTRVTPQMIKEDTSTYNTYLNKGLPEHPVCNVSFEAIRAAIFPAQSDYLYFMKSKNGTHDFSRNYSTHLDNIKRATN